MICDSLHIFLCQSARKQKHADTAIASFYPVPKLTTAKKNTLYGSQWWHAKDTCLLSRPCDRANNFSVSCHRSREAQVGRALLVLQHLWPSDPIKSKNIHLSMYRPLGRTTLTHFILLQKHWSDSWVEGAAAKKEDAGREGVRASEKAKALCLQKEKGTPKFRVTHTHTHTQTEKRGLDFWRVDCRSNALPLPAASSASSRRLDPTTFSNQDCRR
ncbi:hypothetical protein BD289DRAFT_148080 [Coniella lustricola]|uniref:Uncharacterized protein n=1 Tax=Coniella lustricola TaxID=2025994 RepID=A0A2T2ZUW0_9PEZI|nr:hypothetical protein BD289DRAFT_148080 [Coniella lustricola]